MTRSSICMSILDILFANFVYPAEGSLEILEDYINDVLFLYRRDHNVIFRLCLIARNIITYEPKFIYATRDESNDDLCMICQRICLFRKRAAFRRYVVDKPLRVIDLAVGRLVG